MRASDPTVLLISGDAMALVKDPDGSVKGMELVAPTCPTTSSGCADAVFAYKIGVSINSTPLPAAIAEPPTQYPRQNPPPTVPDQPRFTGSMSMMRVKSAGIAKACSIFPSSADNRLMEEVRSMI